jgi:ketosteroid isomerase-like protein
MMTSVNENLVFELGRTRSSNYAYAYIWVRESDGQWKMALFTQ